MCGFIVHQGDSDPCTRFVRRRGPDAVNSVQMSGFTFEHYLLHVTGEKTVQPFIDGDIVCVYNGEIYNHPYSRSDGEVIIPLYREYGPHFAKRLDGEFAIALYDFSRECAVFCTDAFGTKPLWTKGLNAASYGSCLGGVEMPPNTVIQRWFNGRECRCCLHDFDFDNQVKDSFDDWVMAFEAAVAKRAGHACFIGLSSGYDSGAIACALKQQGVDFTAYGVRGSEDLDLLCRRLNDAAGELIVCNSEEYERWKAFIKEWAEECDYSAVPGGPIHCSKMTDDWGAVGSAVLYARAREAGHKVCLCGQGADEIMSDYSLYPDVSTLYGVFPEPLKPWPNFQGGCQHAYLRKEEYIAGCFGIEARYPFLDLAVVQEFLWLHMDLKNLCYKAPLHHYLELHHYPFNHGKKVGFSAI